MSTHGDEIRRQLERFFSFKCALSTAKSPRLRKISHFFFSQPSDAMVDPLNKQKINPVSAFLHALMRPQSQNFEKIFLSKILDSMPHLVATDRNARD